MAPKSFVDPRTCLAVYNHGCYVSLVPRIWQMDVSPELARSHHYRLCNFARRQCDKLFHQSTLDDVMLKFKPRLQPAVDVVMTQLNATAASRIGTKAAKPYQ